MARHRILFFSPYALGRIESGGARRSRLFWDILSRHYDLRTLIHSRGGPDAFCSREGVTHLGVRWGIERFHDPRLRQALRAAMDDFSPALVWVEQFYSVPLIARVAHRRGVRVVYNSQNVEAERFRAWGPLQRGLVSVYERHLVRVADRVVCVSETDRGTFNHAYGTALDKMTVLPNGYDPACFNPCAIPEDARRALWEPFGIAAENPVVVFVGNHGYRPNRAALNVIETTIAPRVMAHNPAITIAVIGPGLPEDRKDHDNLRYLGCVPDLVPYLQAADLLICPLMHGGGSRLKIIEALACGLPVLSTEKGAEGFEEIGEDSHLYRQPLEAFPEQIAALLDTVRGAPPTVSAAVRAHSMDAIEKSTVAYVDSLLSDRS